MIGQIISHYKILEKLGEGGMGVVYKAHDTKLKRTVALKFLPPEMTRDPEAKERFIHEAQAASSLQHNNICNIHDIDEIPGENQIFMVMDCYQGETLKEKIKAEVRRESGSPPVGEQATKQWGLKIKEAVDLIIQVAEGLLEAHNNGIIHRDIKPGNMIITSSGVVKIIDFGLARLAGRTLLTKTGTTLGTIAYMSPEQVRGDQIDHRTDIWSLGAVLYEMITGQLPFKSEYEQAVIYSILNEQPPSLKFLRSEVPIELQRIVETCLQKDPSARFQSMAELLTELKNLKKDTISRDIVPRPRFKKLPTKLKIIGTVLSGLILTAGIVVVIWYFLLKPGMNYPAAPIKRLVVLPFENLGPAENEYFAHGMMEELIVRLSSLSGLGVISRTSANQYAKTNKSLEQIGKELEVDYALEGAVRWTITQGGSDRVRINPNLIRISDKTTVWAESYDRVIDDIFAVQSDISQRVVEKLGITLLESERQTVEKPPTNNLGAYQAYLRARYYEGRPHFTNENWLRVVESYQQAVELDPQFGLAFAELARAHARLYFLWSDHSPTRLESARQAAEKAMVLSPELPAVHLALGYYQLYAYRDPRKALEELTIAEKGMPHKAEIFEAKTAVAMLQGHWEEALEGSKKAFGLSPRDPSIAVDLADFYWILRQYEEAVKTCDIAVELAPDDAWPYLIKTFALWSWKGAYQETRPVLQAVPKEHAWAPWSWYWQEMYERRYRDAIEHLSAIPGEWIRTKCWAMPKSLLIAYAFELLQEQEKSRQSYTYARSLLEAEVRQWPDDPRYHSSLGIAYAHLGLKEKAIREGKRATEILTISRDAFYGLPYLQDLAFIYTTVGETDAALNTLDYLLSIPCWISVEWLKMDPQWDALRTNPKFQRLLEGKKIDEYE